MNRTDSMGACLKRRWFARDTGIPACAAWLLLVLSLAAPSLQAAQVKQPFVTIDKQGVLHTRADERGDRIPDFSHAGYGGGGVPLPVAEVQRVVEPGDGDDGARIQAAIDAVARQQPDARGVRGAVLLAPGRYEIEGQVRIESSGVVLRGSGAGKDGTVLVATGQGRRPLIEVTGLGERTVVGTPVAVADAYVPVGARSLRVRDAREFAPGQRVVVTRPGTSEWIEAVGMHVAPARTGLLWKPDHVTLTWDRVITAVEGDRLTLDAPLTTSIDVAFGGGTVARYTWPERITQVGVERLRCESEVDRANPADEEHAWIAVRLDAVENAWVDGVTAEHFVSSAVYVGGGARAVTVQDCASLAPVSERAGYRRLSFHTSGQLTLFQRCRAEDGRHPFTVGYLAGGPNVFLDCTAERATHFSGSIGSWASGILFDNVTIDGAGLALDHLETWNGGVGWAAANSVIWQCSAAEIVCRRPPTAQNYAVGVWGQFLGDGAWDQVDEFVKPESLYRAQLIQRVGRDAVAALQPQVGRISDPSRLNTQLPVAALSAAPRESGKSTESSGGGHALVLQNGWLSNADTGALFIGSETPTTWWRGSMSPARAHEVRPHLTRFAPGRVGPGATEDLEALVAAMVERGEVSLRHHYGLWYDRRRDDHQRMRRASADVWPPFYEQPWARSGRGEAWDGMSRYDLTKFNPWYFRRLRDFAALGREHGVVLVNEMYFQHNILESGAHWVDSPWRPVNALQETGFPEPPPFTGDTVKVADWFYDISHPVRRELHRAYIRQCLANLAEQPNVIHTTSAEYSGPLHFVQFWLDVIAEWQRETGHDPLIALSVPKDVQDAILADPQRATIIDLIDLTYWWRTDKALYAPSGGENLAPRQHLRKWKGGGPSASSLAGMVHEYRTRFPGKAIMTGIRQPDAWAYVAAGGSFAALPRDTDPALLAALADMQPMGAQKDQWTLGKDGRVRFIVSLAAEAVALSFSGEGRSLEVRRIDPRTGQVSEVLPMDKAISVPASPEGPTVLWISQ